MAQSIRKNANNLFEIAFNSKRWEKDKLGRATIFSDPAIRSVIIAKGDPDLVTPICKQDLPVGTKWYRWGFAEGMDEIPTEYKYSVGDAILSLEPKEINLRYDSTPHLTLSHVVMIKPVQTEGGGIEKHVIVYSLSEKLFYSVLFGNIQQTVYHRSGKIISE
jgi:hypothetical protein